MTNSPATTSTHAETINTVKPNTKEPQNSRGVERGAIVQVIRSMIGNV